MGQNRAVGAGVYIYRMTVGVESQTGRMVLLDGQAGVSAGGMASVMPGASDGGGADGEQVYGLVVSGAGLAPYVDSSFRVAAGMAPVELVVSSGDWGGKATDDDCAFCDLFDALNDDEEGPGPSGKAQATLEAPAAPTNLRFEAVTDSSCTVCWDGVEGATDYDVNYKPAVGGEWTNEPHRGTGLCNTINDLEPDTAYRWAVRAENSDGPSAWVFGPNFTTSEEETDETTEEEAETDSTSSEGGPDSPIEITPVRRGISVTSENQILLELMPQDIVPANPLDLAGRTLTFTPSGNGYSREVRALDWEDDIGNRVSDNEEIEPSFRFDFAGQKWESFFVSRYGLVTFGEPYPFPLVGPDRFGTMAEIALHLGAEGVPPMIAALYKPRLGGWHFLDAERFGNVQHVSRRPDRVVVTWITSDPTFHVHGVPPLEKTRFQMALYADGRIAFHYAPEPGDPDETIRDGIVGLFPGVVKTGLLGSIADPEDRSLPGHLDLVETALYATAVPNRVLVEFTTRGPIRPIPNQTIFYIVIIADGDFWAAVLLRPDGSRTAFWDAGVAYDPDVGDNRIGLLFDSSEFSGHSTSVDAFTLSENQVTGSETRSTGRSAVISFPEATSAPDLSRPDSRPSAAQFEVFRYAMIRDRDEGVEDVSCRIIEVLGDEFDFMAFNSQFRVDVQETGPAHGFAGMYYGNITAEVDGIGIEGGDTTPCKSRLKNTWGFPVWMKASTMNENVPGFAHEIGHTWIAYAHYLKNGERRSLGDGHWAFGLHAPAPFPWQGTENGSHMGGAYWRENSDGTFTALRNEGDDFPFSFSWLDLYLMGLATPDEVPDMFLLHDLEYVGQRQGETYTAAEKEIVTMEQILAAMGPRNPPAQRSRKVFNTGFVYFLLPGQEPDPELLREHADYRDWALEQWRHNTDGRGELTSELPGR